MHIEVHLLPELTTPQTLAGSTSVVIDILRATTTINYAFAAGAKSVIPCLNVDEARARAEAVGDGDGSAEAEAGKVLLGGERGGFKIDGFDLANSPADYTTDAVSGSTIVFTTTNGTKALAVTTECERVLIGAFVNLSAVVAEIASAKQLHLVCAGTNGEITREDVLFAGAVIDRLMTSPKPQECTMNDEARIALASWTEIGSQRYSADVLAEQLRETQGGRNLIGLGLSDDLPRAANLDEFVIVPEFVAGSSWSIRRSLN